MNLQHPLSITDIREDIDSLTDRLASQPYTVVYKNRTPLFVAVDPKWFEVQLNENKLTNKDLDSRKQAAAGIKKLAKKLGRWPSTEILIKMRDREAHQWTE